MKLKKCLVFILIFSAVSTCFGMKSDYKKIIDEALKAKEKYHKKFSEENFTAWETQRKKISPLADTALKEFINNNDMEYLKKLDKVAANIKQDAKFLAITLNNITMLENMINLGGDWEILDFENEQKFVTYSPLHHAASQGKLDFVKLLLKKGAKDSPSYNDQNILQGYPLNYALANNHNEVVKYLLEQGKKLIAQGKKPTGEEYLPSTQKETLLNMARKAIEKNKPTIVKSLIDYEVLSNDFLTKQFELTQKKENKVNFNTLVGVLSGKFLEEKLEKALNKESQDLFNNLYNALKHHNFAPYSIQNILDLVIQRGTIPMLETLHKDKKIKILEHNYLMRALIHKNNDIVKWLINRGAPVKHENEYTVGPIHKAILTYDLEIVKLLVDKKANINYFSKSDWKNHTPLDLTLRHYAFTKHRHSRATNEPEKKERLDQLNKLILIIQYLKANKALKKIETLENVPRDFIIEKNTDVLLQEVLGKPIQPKKIKPKKVTPLKSLQDTLTSLKDKLSELVSQLQGLMGS